MHGIDAITSAETGRLVHIVALQRKGTDFYRCISGWDSDLEAFSLNPSDVASQHWPFDQLREPNV